MECPVHVKASRKTIVAVVGAALTVAIGAGSAVAFHRTAANSFYGASAGQVAQVLQCADYASTTSPSSVADYRDQGTCRLGNYWVKITTFDNQAQGRAFAILMDTLIPAYTNRGGAYAQGAGWNAADDERLAREAAVQVAYQLGGTVHEFSAGSTPTKS